MLLLLKEIQLNPAIFIVNSIVFTAFLFFKYFPILFFSLRLRFYLKFHLLRIRFLFVFFLPQFFNFLCFSRFLFSASFFRLIFLATQMPILLILLRRLRKQLRGLLLAVIRYLIFIVVNKLTLVVFLILLLILFNFFLCAMTSKSIHNL